MGKWFYDKNEKGEPESPGSKYHYMFKNKKIEQFIVIAIILGLAIYYSIMALED